MTTALLLALPWLGILAFVVLAVRMPRELGAPRTGDTAPSVSVIIPARNEAVNIEACIGSVTASNYPDFEVIVVDDRSEDDTLPLARAAPQGRAKRLVVVEGTELPDGWLGKPWACRQGADRAEGEILLFTDADTTHGADLIGRAVAGLEEDGADLLTLMGRQLMESFWERLVQPHIFLMMLFRFPRFEETAKNDRWRDAIANGQFLLFRRDAYETIGGHECVRDEVVEDLALAQQVKRAGLALRIRSAEDDLATRMYRSLGQLVEGWSKNIVMGGLQSLPPLMRPVVPPVAFLGGIALWLVAPLVLVLGLFQWVGGGFAFGGVDLAVGSGSAPFLTMEGTRLAVSTAWLTWATAVYGLSLMTWAWWNRRVGVPVAYALIYPLGAAVGSWIFLRSWTSGSTVRWKGRTYEVPGASERA